MSKTGTRMQVDRELTKRLMRSFAPPVALPEQLRNDLVSAYSARLYGAPGRVSLDTLRIIWPALLGSAARSALHGAVLCSIPVHSLLRNVQPSYKQFCEQILRGEPFTFSQAWQDWYLFHNLFAHRVKWGDGLYVEIGVHHPTRISNTLFFEKCLGWKGV